MVSFCHDSSHFLLTTLEEHSPERGSGILQIAGPSMTMFSGHYAIIGKAIKVGIFVVKTACIFSEALIYYTIYKNLSKSNFSVKNNISAKVFRKRRQRNIMNLSGQMACFASKTIFSIFSIIIVLIPKLDFARNFALSTPGIFPGMFTLFTMWSSPEIMRHYFNVNN